MLVKIFCWKSGQISLLEVKNRTCKAIDFWLCQETCFKISHEWSNDYNYHSIIFLTPNNFPCNTTASSLELFSYNGIITDVDNATMHDMRSEPYDVSFSTKKNYALHHLFYRLFISLSLLNLIPLNFSDNLFCIS